jgi:hypothetical protein
MTTKRIAKPVHPPKPPELSEDEQEVLAAHRALEGQKTRVKGLLGKWAEILKLDAWKISIEFPDTLNASNPDRSCIACVNVLPEYLEATVRVPLDTIEMFDDEKAAHELTHLYLNHLYFLAVEQHPDPEREARHALELAVTSISRLFLPLNTAKEC